MILAGADVFDGTALHPGAALVVEGGQVTALSPAGTALPDGAIQLAGGILCPGFLDLQVNGGGGQLVDGTTTPDALRILCALHARLGATTILPTLITDTPAATRAVLAAATATPGLIGLHLEGPHLDPARAGAHDRALIRPMDEDDLALYAGAARHLTLMVTLAPGAATPDQIARLSAAGVIVSLGHSDCTAELAHQAVRAGARCATHLFNAMSQMTAREPGLVGAVLASDLPAGIIADGHHVAPDSLRVALNARPEGLFLISDCMAVAGSDLTEFTLGHRRILRRDGRLTLADGTLAGADLTLPQAIRTLVSLGIPLARALAMATRIPATVIGCRAGRLTPGSPADIVHLTSDLRLSRVWQAGIPVPNPLPA